VRENRCRIGSDDNGLSVLEESGGHKQQRRPVVVGPREFQRQAGGMIAGCQRQSYQIIVRFVVTILSCAALPLGTPRLLHRILGRSISTPEMPNDRAYLLSAGTAALSRIRQSPILSAAGWVSPHPAIENLLTVPSGRTV